MAEVQLIELGGGAVQIWCEYTTAPGQITGVRGINTSAAPATGTVTRNNGQLTAFTIPAHTLAPGLTVTVNSAQYTCTVDGQGQLDVCPNFDVAWGGP